MPCVTFKGQFYTELKLVYFCLNNVKNFLAVQNLKILKKNLVNIDISNVEKNIPCSAIDDWSKVGWA